MSRFVVDTNVPIVANGDSGPDNTGSPSVNCRIAAVKFLQELLSSGKLLVDLAGDIQDEYRRHLRPSGQPGVGDRFYQALLNSAPERVERIDLPKRDDGEYVDLPQALIDAGFDRSDRKFAALARRENAPVVNATDSDWLNHRETLFETGIRVRFICGCDTSTWFER
ncbi:MAG: hypothetical protein IPM60_08965 [Rhodospirillales bacterium]|nr:hypothetical protein [Rhodospirillales bacterium]